MIDREDEQTAVRQQGDRGTCVGFAVGAAHEWMSGDWEVRSPEDVMWAGHEMMGAHLGEATSVNFALRGLEANEHASEAAWPYGSPEWPDGRPTAALDGANRRVLPAWTRLSTPTLDVIRGELVADNAVMLTIGVVRPAWLKQGGAVDADEGEKIAGNHAVLIVGASEPDEDPALLKVKNSWGVRWGQDGYGLITVRYLEAYSVCAHAIERTT